MILFVVEQVAGAEYILPLVKGPLREAKWTILSSPVSSRLLASESVPHQTMEDCTLLEAEDMTTALQPRIALISASVGGTLEKSFVKVLKRHRIPCIQFIDMWVNYKKRFENIDATEMTYPDLILTIDQEAKSAMEAEGIPGALIEIAGQPYFEFMMGKYSIENRGHTPGNRVLIVTQPIARYYGKTLGYNEVDFVELCLKSLHAAGIAWSLVDICVHPAEALEGYETISRSFSGGISVMRNATLCMSRYESVLGMFSSLLVHGVLAGLRVASVQPGTVRVDASPIADIARLRTEGELIEWIQTGDVTASRSSSKRFRSLRGSTEHVAGLLNSYQWRPNAC